MNPTFANRFRPYFKSPAQLAAAIAGLLLADTALLAATRVHRESFTREPNRTAEGRRHVSATTRTERTQPFAKLPPGPSWRPLPGSVAVRPSPNFSPDDCAAHLTRPDQPLAGYARLEGAPRGWILFEKGGGDANGRATDASAARWAALRADPRLQLADPVFIDRTTGLRAVSTRELIIALRPGVDAPDYFGSEAARVRPVAGTSAQFVLSCPGYPAEWLFEEAKRREADPRVAWAECNLMAQFVRAASPNDPLYALQWHLRNLGQSEGLPGADAKVAAAWNLGARGEGIVVAVLDDGVDVDHPDLQANVFVNEAETPNGADDDGNGYVDDVRGWNFVANHNNPRPADVLDAHGTAVAGIIAATGGNGIGAIGAAPAARLLPIKILTGDFGVASDELAAAIRYAAGLTSPQGWRGADILATSLFFPESAVVSGAITDAARQGREGKGCPVFATSGNGASGYFLFELDDIPPGDYNFEWSYAKDVTMADGEDTAWVADILFPDGTWELFENSSLPAGWDAAPYGGRPWFIEDNPARAFGTSRYQARAGAIGNDTTTDLRSPIIHLDSTGIISFWYWVSSEEGFDGLDLWIYDFALEDWEGPFLNTSGVPPIDTQIRFPASHPEAIAVGASTDFDFRSDYSQYGPELDLVAPSDGGRSGIVTTDRQGLDGYEGEDYTATFGGTSAATPLAAAVAALLLSVNPEMTAAAVRERMRATADKIGQAAYPGGISEYYGYGRVNAEAAVLAFLPPRLTAIGVDGSLVSMRLERVPSSGLVVLERSPDLEDWRPVSTNEANGAALDLMDQAPPSSTGWYYRAVLP